MTTAHRWGAEHIARDPGLAPSGHVVTCHCGRAESLTLKQAAGQRSLVCAGCGDVFRFAIDVAHSPVDGPGAPGGVGWLQSTWMGHCSCLWTTRLHSTREAAAADLATHLEENQ